jgi:hypothetical protein
MRLSVRLLPAGRTSVDVSLDGQPFLPHWEGDPATMGFNQQLWGLRSSHQLGLVAYAVPVTFHSARIRKVADPSAADASEKNGAR